MQTKMPLNEVDINVVRRHTALPVDGLW